MFNSVNRSMNINKENEYFFYGDHFSCSNKPKSNAADYKKT